MVDLAVAETADAADAVVFGCCCVNPNLCALIAFFSSSERVELVDELLKGAADTGPNFSVLF